LKTGARSIGTTRPGKTKNIKTRESSSSSSSSRLSAAVADTDFYQIQLVSLCNPISLSETQSRSSLVRLHPHPHPPSVFIIRRSGNGR
jgi:hypothetical protein